MTPSRNPSFAGSKAKTAQDALSLDLEAGWRLLKFAPSIEGKLWKRVKRDNVVTLVGDRAERERVHQELFEGRSVLALTAGPKPLPQVCMDAFKAFEDYMKPRTVLGQIAFVLATKQKMQVDCPHDLASIVSVVREMGDYQEGIERVLDDWLHGRSWHPEDREMMGLKPVPGDMYDDLEQYDREFLGAVLVRVTTDSFNKAEFESRAFQLLLLALNLKVIGRTVISIHLDDLLKNELVTGGKQGGVVKGLLTHLKILELMRYSLTNLTFVLGWSGTSDEASQLPEGLVETLDATRFRVRG